MKQWFFTFGDFSINHRAEWTKKWDGMLTDKVSKYCAYSERQWYSSRRCADHPRRGEKKCRE